MCIHLFFIYLFVSLFAHAIVRVYRVHVFKKKKTSHAGPVEDKTDFFYCKSCSDCPDAHAHADLELWWSYVFLDAVPYFM